MKPRLLDLFCGAGGAAMGYARAGFEVVGVDIKPQPHYPFEFHQGDALTHPLEGFDAIHASPPCQAYSRLTAGVRPDYDYPDLLPPVRARMAECWTPWVIENVPGAPGPWDLLLCGSMFNLRVKRHRYFQTNGWGLSAFPPFACRHAGQFLDMYSSGAARVGTERQYCDAMGITWAPTNLASECIPPAYTEWIGRQLIAHLEQVAA